MYSKWMFLLVAVVVYISLNLLQLKVLIYNERDVSRSGGVRKNYNKLLLDSAEAPDEDEIIAFAERELPALPFKFIWDNSYRKLLENKTCAQYVQFSDIKFHNTYWQTYENGNVTFQLYGAYYDKRVHVPNGPVVRLLAMINQIDEPFAPNYCQIWYENRTEPVISSVTDYYPIWYKPWGRSPNLLYPHLLTCNLPTDVKTFVPRTVSLVAEPCAHATNNLKVVLEEPTAKEASGGFAVCVKNLVFPYVDMSARLVEWLELVRILGAIKVFIYDLQLHPNVTKVLKYYEQQGFVKVTHITYASGVPSLPSVQRLFMKMDFLNMILEELIPYNDCLYRNMYRYNYLAVMDTDEIIVPLGNRTTWQDIVNFGENIRYDNCTSYAGFCFRNVYFPKYPDSPPYSADVPQYLYMLQHVARVENHSNPLTAAKCFHSTQYVLALHNHFCRNWMKSCSPQFLGTSVGQLQHYREPNMKKTLKHPVVDTSIWRFNDTLVKRTMRVYDELGFFRTMR